MNMEFDDKCQVVNQLHVAFKNIVLVVDDVVFQKEMYILLLNLEDECNLFRK